MKGGCSETRHPQDTVGERFYQEIKMHLQRRLASRVPRIVGKGLDLWKQVSRFSLKRIIVSSIWHERQTYTEI